MGLTEELEVGDICFAVKTTYTEFGQFSIRTTNSIRQEIAEVMASETLPDGTTLGVVVGDDAPPMRVQVKRLKIVGGGIPDYDFFSTVVNRTTGYDMSEVYKYVKLPEHLADQVRAVILLENLGGIYGL